MNSRGNMAFSLLPGVRSLLSAARSHGHRLAVGSSAPRANLDLILELTQTRGHFAAVISSEDTHRGKPDPEVFLLAAARLECVPEECLVMEDAVAGIEAARRAGMRCLAIARDDPDHRAALAAAGATRVVSDWSEVSLPELATLP